MTKDEIYAILEHFSGDTEIYIALPTHNYWRMVAVKPVDEIVEETVKYSDYLQSLEIVEEEDDDTKTVLVLRA